MLDDYPIPPELHQKLVAIREHLINNGCIIQRRERDRRLTWRLRVRIKKNGKYKQLAIPLGANEHVVFAVDDLIHDWRQTAQKQRKEKEQEIRADKEYVQEMVRGGRRRRRFARNVCSEAQKRGDMAVWIMLMGETFRPPVKRVGRPHTRRLRGVASSLMPIESLTSAEA